MSCGDHRCEQLDPVGDELSVGGLPNLAGLGVEAEPPGSIAGDVRGLHVGGAGADGSERLRYPAGDELVAAGGLRPVAALQVALALLAVLVPGLLAGQKLGEDMRLATTRPALVALAAVPAPPIGPVELDS